MSSSTQQEDSAIELTKSETIPLISPTANSTSLSTSDSEDGSGVFDYQYTNSETQSSSNNTNTNNPTKQTFVNPTAISNDSIMPCSKRPPKVYSLHTTTERATKARRRRRDRNDTSQVTMYASDHAHVHRNFSKYNITKRRSGPKKRSYTRRNSDDLTTRSQSTCDQ